MPGIFIGIGGIGGTIVAEVRQALELRVALAGDSPSAQSAAGQFKFLLIDTWKDGAALGFEAAQCFDLPEGKDKFDVDAKIESWYYGGDSAFPKWWPEHRNVPLKVGAYAAGAGQLRIKGKLAYRTALTGQGAQVVPAVQKALQAIDAVLGPAPGIRTVPVYIVCSLGGGTGSGMVLTFAQHLRQTLPRYCPLIGVFPLAGVTELGPGSADKASIWANTDAALREIDYCQRVAGTPENRLTPFFQWPGEGHALSGAERPFEYIYLFGRENQSGQSLGEFTQYAKLIGETLVAESFSSLIDEGLQTGIKGPHSQFIMQLQSRLEVAGRPTSYASAAVGALIYPAERIERHLARRYAAAVLDRLVQRDAAKASAAADAFLKERALVWGGVPSLREELTRPITTPEGRDILLTPMPKKLNPESDQEYARLNRDKTLADVTAARTRLDDYSSKNYLTHLRKRRAAIADAFASPDGGLRAFAIASLSDSGPSALGLTAETVTRIRVALEEQWGDLDVLIEGSPDPAAQKEGMKKALANRQEQWEFDAQRLGKGFGSGLSRIGNNNGKKAKERFFKQTWNPLVQDTLEVERLVEARTLYRDLEVEARRVESALTQLIDQIDVLHAKLESSVAVDIGQHGKTGVLDLAVMDDPRIVAHHFDTMLDQVVKQGANACAIAVTTRRAASEARETLESEQEVAALEAPGETTSQTGLVSRTLLRLLDGSTLSPGLVNDTFRAQLEDAIVRDGSGRLGQQVRALSIWEALAAECRARLALGSQDDAIMDAAAQVQQHQDNAEQAGVPAKDREREVLKAFIRNRLLETQKRVRPFWNLDGLMTANHEHPYHFVVIAADERAYREAETTLGIAGVLDSTAQLMKAGTPQWLPGRDRVVLYAREGVAPLFYLNPGELKQLRDSAAQKSREKVLYTDKRFASLADPVIRPAETEDDRLKYAIAIGMQLGAIDRIAVDGHLNGRLSVRLEHGAVEYPSVRDLQEAITADRALRAEIIARVNREMEGITSAERGGEVQQAMLWAVDLQSEAGDAQLPAEARWWKGAERSLKTRMDYGQYFINN